MAVTVAAMAEGILVPLATVPKAAAAGELGNLSSALAGLPIQLVTVVTAL